MSDGLGGKGFSSGGFGSGGFGQGFGRGFGKKKDLTEAQQDTLNYLKFVKDKEGEEEEKLKPVQWVFDRLSTGQYVTANAVNAALENLNQDEPMEKKIIDVLSAMGRGITGEEKGSYADVIKTHATGDFKEVMDSELFEGRDDEKFLGQATMADLLGLAGDIFLDPTTYFGAGLAGKSTKAAKAAATQFAEDSVKLSLKQMVTNIGTRNMDDLAKVAQAGVDPGIFARKMAKGAGEVTDEAAEYFMKHVKGDMSRQMNTIYNNAYKTALNTPAGELETIMKTGMEPFQQLQEAGITSAREALGEASMTAAEKGTKTALKKQTKAAGKYSRLMEQPKVFSDIENTLVGRYGGREGGAGQRYLAKIFGHELGVAERGPGAVGRGLDRLGDVIKNSGPGDTMAKAWWNVTQNGPIGEVRKALGVRNPYQKLIRMRELEEGSEFFLRKAQENMQNVLKATDGHSDDVKKFYVAANDLAEELSSQKQVVSVFDILNNKIHRETLGITDEVAQGVNQLATDVTTLMRGWHKEYAEAAGKGYVDNMGFIENYLPTVIKDPAVRKASGARKVGSGAKPGFAKTRSYKRAASETMEANKLKWAFGNLDLTDEQAGALVKKYNLSQFEMNLDDLLASRAYAQAMVSKRVRLIDTFKEFGVPLKEMQGNKATKDALMRTGQNLTELGMKQIPEKGLKGYVFDKDVAEVFGRITRATSGETLKKTREMFKKYTTWWKGIVTMTPGFHARNWLSNNMTGFVNHGTKWFNPIMDRDSTVASIYAISKNNPGGLLDQVGMKLSDYNRVLNKKIGTKTVKELADDSIRSGLISEAQMGFSAADSLARMGQKASGNVFSNEFVGREISQQLGSVIENGSKFKSFLIDYGDMMAKAPVDNAAKHAFSETAEQYATMNSKKWFIDYENMCFDTETEILTDNGWRTIDTITETDRALTFNMEEDSMEWKDITYIHRSEFDGKMLHMVNTAFDAMVTPRHRWVRKGGKAGGHVSLKKSKYSIVRAENLIGASRRLKVVSDKYKFPTNKKYSNDFVKLVGWALTEGSYIQKGSSIQVFQSKSQNPENCEELRRLKEVFSETNIYEEKSTSQRDIMTLYIGTPLDKKIRALFPKKQLTQEFIRELTREQAEDLYEIMIKSDGSSTHHNGKRCHDSFTQKGEEFSDSFQFLCFLIGRRSVIRKYDCDLSNCYRISVYKKNTTTYSDQLKIKEIPYKGRVWCIHNANTTLVARRNGQIYISGNTDFEKNTMKNVIPFYSWLRRNLANQVEGIIYQPDLYAMFPKVQEFIKREDPQFEEGLVPDWLSGGASVPVGEKEGQTLMYRMDFPWMDLNKIPLTFKEGSFFPTLDGKELKDELVNAAHPAIKTIASAFTQKGYDFFRGKEMDDWEEAPYALQLMLSNPQTYQWLDGLLRLGGAEDGLKIKKEGNKIEIDPQYAQIIDNAFPFLNQVNYLMYTGTQLIPGLENTIEEMTGIEDNYDKLKQGLQLMSYYTGIKQYPVDMPAEKQKRSRRQYYEARDLRSEARRSLPGYEDRSAKYQDDTDELIERLEREIGRY